MNLTYLCVLICVCLLSACSREDTFISDIESSKNAIKESTSRWYSQEQVALGERIYRQNCIACHLEKATGTKEWKKTLPDGSYPPPPLDGSAHAWHHSLEVLLNVINQGGVPYGGKMPAFAEKLGEKEKIAVISYIQSFWSEDVYQKWIQINNSN